MNELFHGARLKIERAKKHVRDLNGILVRINAHPHAILIETDPNTGYDSLKFEPSEAVPEEFMCIAGDALHNLRTALDFVANDIEFATNGKRSRHTKFPVYDTRDELVAAIHGGFKDKAPERVVNFIVDVIQPYEAGDGKPIWALHALDIEDKHRLLVPYVKFQWIRRVCYKDGTGEVFELPEWAATTDHISKFPTRKRKVEVTDKGKATISVVFAHGLPLGGRHIFPTLNNLAVFIDRTVFSIERKFLES